MERTTEHGRSAQKDTPHVTRQDITNIAIAALSFFMGRVMVFGTVNPIAVPYAAAFLGGNIFFAAAVFAALGLLTHASSQYVSKYIICLALLSAANIALMLAGKTRRANGLLCAAIAGMAALAAGFLVALLNDANLYLSLMALLEGVLSFTVSLIMQKGVAAISGNVRRGALSNEELISLAILAGGITAGAADVFIGALSLRYFLCVLLVLLMAQSGGASVGAAVGLLLGVLINVAGFEGLAFPVILGIGGLVAGGLRDVNKIFAAFGLLASGGILCLYFAPGLLAMELLVSTAVGGITFCFLPNRFMAHIFETVNPQANNASEYVAKVRLLTAHRLQGFSGALQKLSATFGSLAGRKNTLTRKEVNSLIDDVAADTCADCPRHSVCWETEFRETYQTVLTLLGTCETSGTITAADAATDFHALCVKPDGFYAAINHYFALYKASLAWHNKLIESRALVSEQLSGVSRIIGDLAQELDRELDFKADWERKIINACNAHKFPIEHVLVLQDGAGRYEVTVKQPARMHDKAAKQLAALIGQVLGRRMKAEAEPAPVTAHHQPHGSRLRLTETEQFCAAHGMAGTAKTSARESGDSYSFMALPNGRCVMALSDGMGSGRRARAESTAAIELLEEFIESGFDQETAVSMINSALLLKSGDELFSTLDICSIDLHSGSAEFTKIGASTTFLLRDGAVDAIRSWTLPVGVVHTVDADVSRRQLQHGDMLIMVTDGVLDSDMHSSDKEGWLMHAMQEFPACNPQDMAEHLLACAADNYNGAIRDDMTILVTRIWEKS